MKMKLKQIIRGTTYPIRASWSFIHNTPDYLVDGALNSFGFMNQQQKKVRLNGVKPLRLHGVQSRDIGPERMDSLLERLTEYASAETDDLGNDLSELGRFSEYLMFDTVANQFSVIGDNEVPNLSSLLDTVNEQLSGYRDLTIIVEPDNTSLALINRDDYFGKKLARSVIKDRKVKRDLSNALKQGDFLVVDGKHIELVGTSQYSSGLQAWFNYFTNPNLGHLIQQEETAIKEHQEVADSNDIAIGTARGNLRGVKNVTFFVGGAYLASHAAILGAKNLGIDVNPSIVNAVNSAAVVLASYIPSYNEVAEIAGEIDVEQILKIQTAYKVGKEKGDLTLYRRLAADVSSEQTFQQYQIDGWLLASGNTLAMAASGNLDNPAIFATTMSMQVSANNWLGNIAMWVKNHYGPVLRERRREFVAKNPEAIRYFGLEAIVDPIATDEYEDLRRLNEDILQYLPKADGTNAIEQVPESVQKLRQEISDEVDRYVNSYMEEFNQYSSAKKQRKIITLVLGDQAKRLGPFLFNKSKSLAKEVLTSYRLAPYALNKSKDLGQTLLNNVGFGNRDVDSVDQGIEKIVKPNFLYRVKNVIVDVPKSLGLPTPWPYPLPTPIAYSDLRPSEGSFFNRSFPFYNVAVPLGFLGMFIAIGSSDFSPADALKNTEINNMIDALKLTFAGVAFQGLITAVGAADTAGAAFLAALEIPSDAARKAKSWFKGSHAKSAYNAIFGKNSDVVYDIPIDSRSIQDQTSDLLAPQYQASIHNKISEIAAKGYEMIPTDRLKRLYNAVVQDNIIGHLSGILNPTRALEELDNSLTLQRTYRNGLLDRTRVTAIRQPGQDSFRLYSNRDLGENLERYRVPSEIKDFDRMEPGLVTGNNYIGPLELYRRNLERTEPGLLSMETAIASLLSYKETVGNHIKTLREKIPFIGGGKG